MSKGLNQKLKNLSVVIVSHVFATGPALDLEEFLQPRAGSLMFIGHPFADRAGEGSFYRFYTKGKLEDKHKGFFLKLPPFLLYFKEALYTFLWVFIKQRNVDLYVGSDNFSAFLGLALRRIGKVKKVIFYTIDFSHKRFDNLVFNWLYHYFEKQCLINSDVIWNVSPTIVDARGRAYPKEARRFKRQITVPLGVWHDRIPRLSFSRRHKSRIIFLGHVLEKQGLELVVKSLPIILKKVPKVEFVVIGTGPYLDYLEELVSDMGLLEHVDFRGFVEDHKQVEEELAKSAISVAMYQPDPGSFTYYADPGKIKNYLSAGLPVVLTDVPPIARELVRRRCGFVSRYDASSLSRHIVKLLKDRRLLAEYSKNAVKYAENFDWNKVFSRAFRESLW